MALMFKILTSYIFLSFIFPLEHSFASSEKIWGSVVKDFDLKRYMGKWYVIAHKPTFMEKGAYASTETYILRDDGRLDIDYRHHQDSLSGRERKIPQIGEVAGSPKDGHLKVKFPYVPVKFDYLITEVAPDYSHVVVTVPNGEYLWVMARTPVIDSKVYEGIIAGIKKLDIDLSNLRKVPQVE